VQDAKVPAIALECLHRTMWVYVYRIRSESNDKTQGMPRGSGAPKGKEVCECV
jgi:hypothetical protein